MTRRKVVNIVSKRIKQLKDRVKENPAPYDRVVIAELIEIRQKINDLQ